MKKRSSLLLIATIIMSIGFGINVTAESSLNMINKPIMKPMSSLSGDVTFPFGKSLHLENDNYWNMTDLLDVNQTLDNIPSFEASGIIAYTGNQLVPQIDANRTYVKVTLLNATIYDDHDPIGNGEVYFNSTINGNFTESETYSVTNNDDIDLNLVVFESWCIILDINVEVDEDDTWDIPPSGDDELGVFSYYTTKPVNETISGLTDIGDAKVWVKIEVFDNLTGVTADFLAEGCKPYLYFADETSSTEEADEVYARVLVGYDTSLGKDVVCLQYIYYWVEEDLPDPIGIDYHEDDYEEFLIFIDPDDFFHPYRYVFDDGGYVSNLGSQRIAIWEDTADTGELETTVYINDEVIPLLGDNYSAIYHMFNLANADQELLRGLSGIYTMRIIVQTSFHNFREGPPDILDFVSTELGYNYSISGFNDSIIREFYRRHYHAFEEGLWFISYIGVDKPKVHPFSFDIMDPFKFPYLVNAYYNVVEDIDAFQKANKNYINYEYEMDLTLALLMKARYTITSPDQVDPGDEFDATIEVEILEDETEIALLYDLFLNGTIKAVFYEKNFLFDHEGKVSINIPVKTARLILSLLGYQPYEESDLNLDESGYMTLDNFQLSLNLLGEIMEANASLHIWDLIKGEMPGYFPITEKPLNILDFFMDSIDIKMGSVFSGFVNGTIASSKPSIATVSTDEFEFDGTIIQTTTHVTVSSDVTSSDAFNIILDDLLFVYQFLADWSLEINFENIIALIAPQYAQMAFDLGTFPFIELDSDDSLVEGDSTVSKSTSVYIEETTETGGIQVVAITITILSGLTVIVLLRKYKK